MALTTEGFVISTVPQIIAEGADAGVLVIRVLTLYNPNSTAVSFVLRKVVDLADDSEAVYIRFDDSIAPLNTWSHGLVGTPVMLIFPGQRYEVVLDATPTHGIHWVCDLSRA